MNNKTQKRRRAIKLIEAIDAINEAINSNACDVRITTNTTEYSFPGNIMAADLPSMMEKKIGIWIQATGNVSIVPRGGYQPRKGSGTPLPPPTEE